MSTDVCCGTCKFWEKTSNKPSVGDCLAPVPNAVYEHEKSFMFANDGKLCEAWKKKRKDKKK